MDEDEQRRARQEFLRLPLGDSVIAFFSTSIFGQGKAGLVLTTASVQWLTGAEPQRIGYAQLRPERISWSDKQLKIGDHQAELDTEVDAEAAGRVLQGCLRLLAVRPGPPECYCGAPMHWFVFGPKAAVCAGCRTTIEYW
ncbi:hypothetical protein DB30_00150 [Enhygromyxa salina]|uniref:Uncharacterized protein n=2 Tax=Enhygromyxa salina TaxID=215803 RepID=A0A0C2D9A1_9BACT|nr:hypothetical protein DB30_00150 [Enhygromyxa salina]